MPLLDRQTELMAIPDDPAVEEADREAIAPIDHDPSSPALQAIEKLAMRLLQGGSAGS